MKQKVIIPTCDNHQGLYSITVELEWICPRCGKPRGEIKKGRSFDGSLSVRVDTWENPCGHIDKYFEVRNEANANFLSLGDLHCACYNMNCKRGEYSSDCPSYCWIAEEIKRKSKAAEEKAL